MESKVAQALKLKYHPVAIVWTDDKPEKAMRGIGDAVNLLTLSFKVAFRVSERYGNWG